PVIVAGLTPDSSPNTPVPPVDASGPRLPDTAIAAASDISGDVARLDSSVVRPIPMDVASTLGFAPTAEDREQDRLRRRVIGLLANAAVRYIRLTVDALDEETCQKVDTAIRETPHSTLDYGSISIDQNIILDSSGSEPSVVFALSLNEQEFDRFSHRL